MPLNLKYLEMSQNSNNLSVPEKVQDGVSHTPLADAIICKSSSHFPGFNSKPKDLETSILLLSTYFGFSEYTYDHGY